MRKAARHLADASDLADAPPRFVDRARELLDRVAEETQEHPLRSVGWAASAGFVLAGGLFTPLTGKTLRAGLHLALRMAVLPVLTRGLAEMATRVLDETNGHGTGRGTGHGTHQQAEEKT